MTLYNIIFTKFDTNVKHHQPRCAMDKNDNAMFFHGIIHLSFLVWKSCQLFNFKTVLDIFKKLSKWSVTVQRKGITTPYKFFDDGVGRVE